MKLSFSDAGLTVRFYQLVGSFVFSFCFKSSRNLLKCQHALMPRPPLPLETCFQLLRDPGASTVQRTPVLLPNIRQRKEARRWWVSRGQALVTPVIRALAFLSWSWCYHHRPTWSFVTLPVHSRGSDPVAAALQGVPASATHSVAPSSPCAWLVSEPTHPHACPTTSRLSSLPILVRRCVLSTYVFQKVLSSFCKALQAGGLCMPCVWEKKLLQGTRRIAGCPSRGLLSPRPWRSCCIVLWLWLLCTSSTSNPNDTGYRNGDIVFLSSGRQRLENYGEADALMLYLWRCKSSQQFWTAMWQQRYKILARRALWMFNSTCWNSPYRNKRSRPQKLKRKGGHYRKGKEKGK